MKKTHIQILEICVHLMVTFFFISYGYNNYELFDAVENGYKKVGFTITTNIYTGLISVVLFSLYLVYWFTLYYGILKRELELKIKVLSILASSLVMTAIHTGISFLLVLVIQSNGLDSGQQIAFQFIWDPTNALYSWYLFVGIITFAFWGTFEFLYNYEELLNARRVESELSLVRSQIRPHFFFNTLNSMYSMALTSGNETLAKGLQDLTGMMRHTMEYASHKKVRLDKEWEYLNRYAELQKLRVDPDHVELEFTAKGELSNAQIAPMLLINFVENAFKHGISMEKESFIRISLEVTAAEIQFRIENSSHPSKQDQGSGIGTPQTRKLLSLVYGTHFQLQETEQDSIYSVELTLPKEL